MTPPRRVLVDSGPLYALKASRDQHHRRAQMEFTGLRAGGVVLVACQPVLVEVYGLTLKRHGSGGALRLLETLRRGTSWIAPPVAVSVEAAALLERYPDRRISFADAHLAVLSERLSVPIWTFDGHFHWLGSNVWRA